MSWLFDIHHQNTPELVPPEAALKGGSTPVLEHPEAHLVLNTPITGPWEPGQKVVYFGLGCYWGAEKMFWEHRGVLSTSVGFAGGVTPNPTYREVCTGRTNHTEIVEVVYDPQQVSFAELTRAFFEAHDPTQGFRQGNDVGTQYRSAIYTAGPDAEQEAEQARKIAKRYASKLKDAGYGTLTTEICPLRETPAGAYYRGEQEHQQYLIRVPGGYCPHHSTGVACDIPSQ